MLCRHSSLTVWNRSIQFPKTLIFENFEFHLIRKKLSLTINRNFGVTGPKLGDQVPVQSLVQHGFPSQSLFLNSTLTFSCLIKKLLKYFQTSDYKAMEKMAKKAAQAIALVTGTHYDVGPSSKLLNPSSGLQMIY